MFVDLPQLVLVKYYGGLMSLADEPDIASITMETVPLYSNFIMYKVLATV